MRAAGYKPNNGLHDQRIALQWLHKYLPGFGGDPGNITLAGESAGSISVCAHLLSKEPLFKRVVNMSGTMLTIPPVALDSAEENYQSALKSLGIAEHGAIEHLLKMDSQELVGRFAQSGIPLVPVVDEDIFPAAFDFASMMEGKTDIAGTQYCQSAMIGDCQFDGSIHALRVMHLKKGIGSTFCTSMSNSFASRAGFADKVLSAYDIHSDLPDDVALFRILQFANDISFYVPSRVLAASLSPSVQTHQYRFNEPNPWNGQWKGHAAHVVDIVFLFQNFNEFLDERQKGVAVQFAKDVITFVNGEEPWTAGVDIVKVFDPVVGMAVVDDASEKTGRRKAMLELGEEVGLDVINNAFNAFARGPSPA
jgi:carboxylesterase type B